VGSISLGGSPLPSAGGYDIVLASLIWGGNTGVSWITTYGGPGDDNALAGCVAAGTPFPTGHLFAPSHTGCRCLLVPADR